LAGLLQGSERAEHGIEEEEQDEQAILVVMQAPVPGPVTVVADIMELVEHRQEPLEVLNRSVTESLSESVT